MTTLYDSEAIVTCALGSHPHVKDESTTHLRCKDATPTRREREVFDGPAPSPNLYTEAEVFVAGALSTMPPFDVHHPAYALPFARRAIEALGNWEPSS